MEDKRGTEPMPSRGDDRVPSNTLLGFGRTEKAME